VELKSQGFKGNIADGTVNASADRFVKQEQLLLVHIDGSWFPKQLLFFPRSTDVFPG